ncbi:hypothetical protein [Humibacter albus]|uniref:hypothetical protein n=1 Tax=Humibacter albus TaxID=427754 RepID=UPI0003B5D0A0|nr:hypothetical protein [Humibacter albus]
MDDETLARIKRQREADLELAERRRKAGEFEAQHPEYYPRARTHKEIVRLRLGWIVAGVWIIAAAVIANFIAGIVIGASAAASIY